ncbi:MAG: CDP-alcohol phosphatidyltransferase family protein [Pseudolabrys sp.]|nr:CDP-alcohol phosphatidyltransferase family protein [Pseudolabrys sp.]
MATRFRTRSCASPESRGGTAKSQFAQWLARRYTPLDELPFSRPRAGGFLPQAGIVLSIPNLITLGRILLVPVVVWAIASNAMWIAFVLFLVAGVSDAVDGFLAKRFDMTTELGAYLDPLADKALIVSIYLTLGINGDIPRWLVILVVSRDILIVGGIMLSWLMGSPLKIRPLLVSKLNTVAQIVFACVVLGSLGFHYEVSMLKLVLMGLVAVLTLLSIAAYLAEWVRHMNSATTGQ